MTADILGGDIELAPAVETGDGGVEKDHEASSTQVDQCWASPAFLVPPVLIRVPRRKELT